VLTVDISYIFTSKISECVEAAASSWMTSSGLQPNAEKTKSCVVRLVDVSIITNIFTADSPLIRQSSVVCSRSGHLYRHSYTVSTVTFLLQRLRSKFGIGGQALSWIASFLQDRTKTSLLQAVLVRSSPVTLVFGVPQGSFRTTSVLVVSV